VNESKAIVIKDEEPRNKAEGVDAPRAATRPWTDWTGGQKAMAVFRAAIQMAITGWALWDIRRRPADQIKGRKALWAAVAFMSGGYGFLVIPVGPIAYFLFGRKR
jgi:hypothetical protein